MKCPYCSTDMDPLDYEEVPTLNIWEITRFWRYECPNCGRQWEEMYKYKCIEHTTDEMKVEC